MIRVFNFNCKGLNDPKKTSMVLNYFKIVQSVDVLVLTETHWVEEPCSLNFLKTSITKYKSNSRGVAIIVFNKQIEIINSIIDDRGRFIYNELMIDNSYKIKILGLYSPSIDGPEKITFAKFIIKKFKHFNMDVVTGDLNNIILKEDSHNGKTHYYNSTQLLLDGFNLKDAWLINQKGIRFTYSNKSRIDIFLAPSTTCLFVTMKK